MVYHEIKFRSSKKQCSCHEEGVKQAALLEWQEPQRALNPSVVRDVCAEHMLLDFEE